MNRTTSTPGRCIDYPILVPTDQFPGWLSLTGSEGDRHPRRLLPQHGHADGGSLPLRGPASPLRARLPPGGAETRALRPARLVEHH